MVLVSNPRAEAYVVAPWFTADRRLPATAPGCRRRGVCLSAVFRCQTRRVILLLDQIRRWRAGLALVVLLAVVAVGCGDDGGEEAGEGDRAGETAEEPQARVAIEDQPGDVEATGALRDVSGLVCEAEGSEWVATGQVTNPTDAAATYRIFISFLDADRDTVGVVQTTVDDVPSGEPVDWSARLDLSSDDLECVLRVERFVAE